MKKILIVAGVLAALAVIGLLIVAMNLGSIVKAGVETVGPTLTKTTLKLDKASFSLFAGRAELDGLSVGNPTGFKSESAITVGEVVLQVKPSSVASDVVEIDEITIKAPVITYEQGMSGNNLSKLLANVNESTASLTGTKEPAKKEDKSAPAAPASEKRFRVKLVRVEGATVKVSATILGGTALPIPLPPITIENIGTTGPGVTAGELTAEVLRQVLSGVTKAVTESLTKGGGLLKDAAGGAVDKAGEGLKNLFKKK